MSHSNVSYETRLLMLSMLGSAHYQKTGRIDEHLLEIQATKLFRLADKMEAEAGTPDPKKTLADIISGHLSSRNPKPILQIGYVIRTNGFNPSGFDEANVTEVIQHPSGDIIVTGRCNREIFEKALWTFDREARFTAASYVEVADAWIPHSYYAKSNGTNSFAVFAASSSQVADETVQSLKPYLSTKPKASPSDGASEAQLGPFSDPFFTNDLFPGKN